MRFKYLLLLLLLIPSLVSGAMCCSRTQIPGWWGSVDYLLAWRKKRPYPPLLTTSPLGTPLADAGVLGLPTTSILFGGKGLWDSPKSGGAFDFGLWVTNCCGFGIDGFFPADEKISYEASSDANGFPILARPYINVNTGANDALVFSYPGEAFNSFGEFEIKNRVWGLNFYSRYKYLDNQQFRIDLLCGFMYNQISESLETFTSLESLTLPGNVTELDWSELFKGKNNYYAALFGVDTELRWGWTGLQLIGKLGIGGVVNTAEVKGNGTAVLDLGGGVFDVINFEGGLFAQQSNIGSKSRAKFAVVPEFQAKINYHRYKNIGFSLGYLLVYWSNVTLANNVFDLTVNPDRAFGGIFGGGPTGPLAPLLEVNTSSFWLQSLTAGIYFRF